MPTTFAPIIGLSQELAVQTCNCHYPIGLVVFLLFTIASLLVCICVCCFDLSQCIKGRQKRGSDLKFRRSSMNARFVEPSKFVIDRKLSLDPCLIEYTQLFNSGSVSSSNKSRSIEAPPMFSYSTDRSLVSTV